MTRVGGAWPPEPQGGCVKIPIGALCPDIVVKALFTRGKQRGEPARRSSPGTCPRGAILDPRLSLMACSEVPTL